MTDLTPERLAELRRKLDTCKGLATGYFPLTIDEATALLNMADERDRLAAKRFPIMHGSDIPWAVIAPCERQAQNNHSQTLKHLAGRGGLGVCEAVAVLESRDWRPMEPDAALSRLTELVSEREANPRATAAEATGRKLAEVANKFVSACGPKGRLSVSVRPSQMAALKPWHDLQDLLAAPEVKALRESGT